MSCLKPDWYVYSPPTPGLKNLYSNLELGRDAIIMLADENANDYDVFLDKYKTIRLKPARLQ